MAGMKMQLVKSGLFLCLEQVKHVFFVFPK
jgi:hypothetical protein